MKNTDHTITAASAQKPLLARRGGSGGFAAGGGDVSPGNSRLGTRQTWSEAEAAVMTHGAECVGHGEKAESEENH